MNMNFLRKLPIPQQIKNRYPLSEKEIEIKQNRDTELKEIFEGKSDKFILIIGPCSADNKESVIDYVSRLKSVADEVKEKIFVIPRIYTNKPRTSGDGYKGMLHQPNPLKQPDMLNGILSIRDLHTTVLRDFHFTCADEMLYPEDYRYLSDVLGYVAVGARSVENQQHRLTASGISVPVGMKNPTSGDLTVMLNAVATAQHGHTFIYRGWEVVSQGNEYAHSILRGFTASDSKCVPNYKYDDLLSLNKLNYDFGIKNPAVIIDTNHANSNKQYLEQIKIAKDVQQSRKNNPDIKKMVKGIMIESYIEDGAQNIGGHTFGQSITDPCLGWEKSKKLIYDIADML